jgi:hypothetical protein
MRYSHESLGHRPGFNFAGEKYMKGDEPVTVLRHNHGAGEPLNLPDGVWTESFVCLCHPCGGETITLSAEEVERYKRDPDGFAATHFRPTTNEYREWIAETGLPRCAARTKSGQLCRNSVGPQSDAFQWKATHRLLFCSVHCGDTA